MYKQSEGGRKSQEAGPARPSIKAGGGKNGRERERERERQGRVGARVSKEVRVGIVGLG